MIRFYNYLSREILGGLFEIYEETLPKSYLLHGGLHMFYHNSGKLLVRGEELNYTPLVTYYKNISDSIPSSLLETRYWFLSRDEYRKFYRECKILRRVDDKSWEGLYRFNKLGSRSNIILKLKEDVEAQSISRILGTH